MRIIIIFLFISHQQLVIFLDHTAVWSIFVSLSLHSNRLSSHYSISEGGTTFLCHSRRVLCISRWMDAGGRKPKAGCGPDLQQCVTLWLHRFWVTWERQHWNQPSDGAFHCGTETKSHFKSLELETFSKSGAKDSLGRHCGINLYVCCIYSKIISVAEFPLVFCTALSVLLL